jgi:hypothetical protein
MIPTRRLVERSKTMLLNPIFNYDSIYDCFTCMRADRYIGDEGYFAENREDFSRLDSCPRGTLAGIRPDSSHSFITLVGGDRLCYRYFYPLSEVSAADAPAPSDTEVPASSDADDSVEPFVTPFDFPAPTPMTDEAARFAQKFRVGSLIRYRRNLLARQKDAGNMRRGVVAVVTEVDLDNGSVVLGRTRRSLDYLCRLFEYFDPYVGDWKPFKF